MSNVSTERRVLSALILLMSPPIVTMLLTLAAARCLWQTLCGRPEYGWHTLLDEVDRQADLYRYYVTQVRGEE